MFELRNSIHYNPSMSTITFDTHEFVTKLREAGLDEKQSEAVVRAISAAQGELVTRDYLDMRLTNEFAPIKAELLVIKWMMTVLIGLAIANFAKQFF